MVNQMRKFKVDGDYVRKPSVREVPAAHERQAINSWQTELCFLLFLCGIDQTLEKDRLPLCVVKNLSVNPAHR